jgi:hypothetical protein
MTTNPQDNSTRNKLLGGILAAAVAVCVLSYVLSNLGVRGEIKQVKAAGLPVTLAELETWYATPADNAAPTLQSAFGHLMPTGTAPYDAIEAWQQNGELTDDEARTLRAFVKSQASALPLLKAAAAQQGCRFNVSFTAGVNTLLPHLQRMRDSARLLTAQAAIQASDGDIDGALATTGQVYALAAHLGNEPTLISQLVSMAMVAIANRTNIGLLRHDLSYDQLRTVADQAIAAEAAYSMQAGFIGERCFGHDVFSNPGVLAPATKVTLTQSSAATVYGATGLKGGDNATFLKTLAAFSAVLDLPPEERLAAARAAEDQWVKERSRVRVLSNMLLPSLVGAVKKDVRVQAELRHLQYAAAALMHADTHGELPGDLRELSYSWLKRPPTDLFTGKTLQYERGDDGFMIFSPGENMTDDRAAARPRAATRSDDIVLRITR